MVLEDYLKKLQDENMGGATSSAAGMGFAIDSFPGSSRYKKKKKKAVLRVAYPNENVSMKKELFYRAMIDIDGTIHKYSKGFQDGSLYDDPFEGAREVINWLKDLGFEIVIFTTRASQESAKEFGQDHTEEIMKVQNWLSNNNIYYDRVTAEKLAADFYIDDKAILIKDGNWDAVKEEIKERIK